MNNSVLLNKKEVRKNKVLRNIQKNYCRQHRTVKGHFPKATIGKVVKLREANSFFDFTDSAINKQEPPLLTKEVILNAVKQQGVCGFGGSGFPTQQKLQAVLNSAAKDKYLIINGVECDPGLIHDEWLIKYHRDEIEKGILLLAKCIGFKKIVLAVKDEISVSNSGYEVCTVPNRYPMGAERILIQTVLGITVPQDIIPSKKGILVLNVQTIHAIYEAVYLNRPADTRFITVADLSTGDAVVARVKLGMTVLDIAKRIAGARLNQSVYFGSGVMGATRALAKDKVSAETNLIGYGKATSFEIDPKCIKCGACARKCPMQLKVKNIIRGIEDNNLSAIKELHPERCIQCGTCTYFCHAGKNVMKAVASVKGEVQ